MLRLKFDSPIEEALPATLRDRLRSAVHAALNHVIAYHEETHRVRELSLHWKQVGAWLVAHDLIRSAQTNWPPDQWEFPPIFCVQPDTAEFPKFAGIRWTAFHLNRFRGRTASMSSFLQRVTATRKPQQAGFP
jgi:hypothetical protein